MSIRGIRFMVAIVGIAGLAAAGIAWATPPQEKQTKTVIHRWIQQFGMTSPAFGQTLRLHVVHLRTETPPDPNLTELPQAAVGFPPDPCRVGIVFFNSSGHQIGQPVFRTVEAGQSTFVDLTFSLPETNAFPPDPCRATVVVAQVGPRGGFPPDPCKATLELLDTASGRVTVHMTPVGQHALPAIQ